MTEAARMEATWAALTTWARPARISGVMTIVPAWRCAMRPARPAWPGILLISLRSPPGLAFLYASSRRQELGAQAFHRSSVGRPHGSVA